MTLRMQVGPSRFAESGWNVRLLNPGFCYDSLSYCAAFTHLTANTQIAPPSTTSGNLPGN